MNQDTQKLYQLLLQQMSAETYLEGNGQAGNEIVRAALRRGNNRFNADLPTSGPTKFTSAQVDEFLARYEIRHQLSDNPADRQPKTFNGIPLNTGFSATLLYDRTTQTYTLSIRSTEIKPWAEGGDKERDLFADWALATNGFAWAQIDTMERYYDWLKSSGTLPANARFNVTGYSLGGHLATVFTELHRNETGPTLLETVTFNAPGRGTWDQSKGSLSSMLAFYRSVLANPDAYIPLTNSRLLTDYLLAKAAVGTVNGLSIYADTRHRWAQIATSSVFATRGLILLPSNPTRTGLTNGAGSITTHVYGREYAGGWNATANSGVHGDARGVFIESQPAVAGTPPELGGSGDYAGSHSIVLLADSLALMRALNQLDGAQTIDQLGEIFARASSLKPDGTLVGDGADAKAEFDVLENALDALRRALRGATVSSTPYASGGRGFGDIAARDRWYNNLKEVTDSASFAALEDRVTIVPVNSGNAAALEKGAGSDFGEWVALRTLAPFVLKPRQGDAGAAAALNEAWRVGHETDYASWQLDAGLTALQRAAGESAFSEKWYADRAAMLRWLLTANERNIDYASSGNRLVLQNAGQPAVYQDVQSAITFTVSAVALPADAPGVSRIIFGRDGEPDVLTGADGEDRFYGGSGGDELNGLDGNDYLEGNAGHDDLRGGKGADVLVGGDGGDELKGGLGDDLLLGGQGNDVYFFNNGEGVDTIIDAGGFGQINWGGVTLTGGLRESEQVWRSADGRFLYWMSGSAARQNLYIAQAGAAGTLIVKDFSRADRDLSLDLSDSPFVRPPLQTTRDIVGDLALLDTDPDAPGVQTMLDDIGNSRRSQQPEPGRADYFTDSSGNDRIRAGGGADFIGWSHGGSDDIDAGDGNDGVSSGDGADRLAGGNGADELAGGNGSDVLLGGAGDDVVMTEHEIAYDSSTYALVVPPGASVVRQWTYDGRFAAQGYGIQVVQYTLEGITFESPWVGIGGWIERRDAAAQDFVDAGDGSDLVYGGYGSDVILGGEGSDRIEGSGGSDFIDGGGGNDLLSGDAPAGGGVVSAVAPSMHGSDSVFGGAGNDLLLGGAGGDVLDGGTGDDVLYGDIAGMSMAMPIGTPFLEPQGMHGADTLFGGAGNDRLRGEGGNDVLVGGTGNDTLNGDEGSDVYVIDRGDGADVLQADFAGPGGDELHFGSAIRADEIVLSRVGFDLQIDTGAPGDSVRVLNWFTPGAERQLVNIRFADGTAWSSDVINARFVLQQSGTAQNDFLTGFKGQDVIAGGDGNDTLRGSTGADVLDGGRGNDFLDGGADNDVYLFRSGDGADVIEARDHPGDDVLRFIGIGSADVSFSRSANALVIGVCNTTDRVTIDRFFEATTAGASRSVSGIQNVEFDGEARVSFAQIRAMLLSPVNGTAAADYIIGGPADELMAGGGGNDSLYGYHGHDTLLGGDGNDVLDGGPGADTFDGGPGDDVLSSQGTAGGDDTFVFARGYGRDMVLEDDTALSNDRLVLAELVPGDVAFGRGDSGSLIGAAEGDRDLIVRVRGGTDTLRVANFFDEPRFWIEAVEFSDGTIWTREQVLANLGFDATPSAGHDSLLGSPDSDSIDAGPGNDVLWLGDGHDEGAGGDGDDHLQGGAGMDSLSGGAGNDRLYGGIGADTLDGGPGEDMLFGGNNIFHTDAASDTYVFRLGSGRDTIVHVASSTGPADMILLEGLAPSEVEFGWTLSNDLQIRVPGTDDVLLVEKQFERVVPRLELFKFGDGSTLAAAEVEALARLNRDDFLNGTNGPDLLDGGAGDDDLRGGDGNDTLLGGAGRDRLDGESGADAMDGGLGDDLYVVDNTGDVVIESAAGGVDRISSYVSYSLPQNVESLFLFGSSPINATGNALDNVITGSGMANRLDGGAGNDVLDGGGGTDTMLGGAGDDTFYVDGSSDSISESANEGVDLVVSTASRALGANQEHLTLAGSSAINGTGNSASNHLRGNIANNTLNGSGGTDVLQGAGGNDTLTDTSGRGVLDGGQGADSLAGGTDRQFLAGGAGNDTLTLGGGADVVAFNRGHGADTVNAAVTGAGAGEKNDTLSLAGAAYSELRLAREAGDLVVRMAGTSDAIRLKGWYASASNQTVSTLQVIVDSTGDYNPASADGLRNRRVVRLNFGSLVSAFNAAGSPSDWVIPQAALAAAFLSGSDTDAIGGSLAYRYGRDGHLAGVDFATAVGVLGDAGFGVAVQSIGSGPTSGGARLLRLGSADVLAVAAWQPGEDDAIRLDDDGLLPADPAVKSASPLLRATLGFDDNQWVRGHPVDRTVAVEGDGRGLQAIAAADLVPREAPGFGLETVQEAEFSAVAPFSRASESAPALQWSLVNQAFRLPPDAVSESLLGSDDPAYVTASTALMTANAGAWADSHARPWRFAALR